MDKSYRCGCALVWLLAVVLGCVHAASAGVWVAAGTNFDGVSEDFAIDPLRPTTVYANFGGFGHGGFGSSTNGGGRWRLIGTTPESHGPVLLDSAHPNTFYVGNVKTTDGGLTWSHGTVPLRGTPAGLAMDPGDPNILYAALYNTGFGNNTFDDGVYKTTDAGDTWLPVKNGLVTGVNYHSIVIDPSNTSILYTSAVGGGVFKTTNAGSSWSVANAGLSSTLAFGLVIDPSNANTLYVATGTGVYKSTDGAANWQPTTSAFLSGDSAVPLAIAPSDPSTLYTAALVNGDVVVARTTDAGDNWEPLSDGIPVTANLASLAVDPTDAQVAYAGEVFGDVYTFVALCGLAPQAGCKRPVSAKAATVSLKRGRKESSDSLTWKWNKGAVTTSAELGDPTVDTDYTLCMYDGTSRLVFWASAPAGGTCGTKPCWKATKAGFTYNNKSKLPRGIKGVALTKGDLPGKAKVTVSASGVNLAPPSLPLDQSAAVTVQLVNSNGTCWDAAYSTATRNDVKAFKAKSD